MFDFAGAQAICVKNATAVASGVSRKSEWEGTKCQKFTGNEIHWERIPPL